MVSSSETEGVIKTLLIKTNHRTIALKSNLFFSKKTLKCQKKKIPKQREKACFFLSFLFFLIVSNEELLYF